MFSDKITQSIAEAAKKVMGEELKGDQHKIDANKNNKIDAHDFKLLRAKKQVAEAKYEPAEPDAEAIAKRKAREEAQRRREEKAERDADDLNKDYKPKTVTKTTTKVAGRAYGGAKQKDIEEEVELEEGRRSYGGGDYYQGGGHSYHTTNSDGTDISVYVPPKRNPVERRVPTYKS